jgi:hypothetical protein
MRFDFVPTAEPRQFNDAYDCIINGLAAMKARRDTI